MSDGSPVWGGHASRVWAIASSLSRTFQKPVSARRRNQRARRARYPEKTATATITPLQLKPALSSSSRRVNRIVNTINTATAPT